MGKTLQKNKGRAFAGLGAGASTRSAERGWLDVAGASSAVLPGTEARCFGDGRGMGVGFCPAPCACGAMRGMTGGDGGRCDHGGGATEGKRGRQWSAT